MEAFAITEWNDLISPLYDAACSLLIVRSDGKRSSVNAKALTLNEKADRCIKEGVAVVVCGAISTVARMLLEERGVRVLSWVSGPIEAVIDLYQKGGDVTALFAMPGCRCGNHRTKQRGQCRRHESAKTSTVVSAIKKERLV